MRIDKSAKHWKLTPWNHQLQAINRALSLKDGEERTSYLLALDLGTGKSKTVIEIARLQYAKAGRMLRTLVVCPPIVQKNWPAEFDKNSNIHPIVVPLGTGTKRLKTITDKMFTIGGTKKNVVCVVAYQTLLMKKVFDKLVEWKPELIIYDEVHYLKNSQSKRSKAAYKLSKISTYRYGLTGTPISNSPMDLFGIYKPLDLGETFGVSVVGFKAKYFYDKNAHMNREVHFPKWELQPNALPKITKLLEDTSMSVDKDKCLDLPPFVVKNIFVELSDEQKKAYRELKRDLITFVKGNSDPATAQLAVTKALRLQQIASGHIKLESGDIHAFKETPRDKALAEILEAVVRDNSKTIIWAVFKQNYTAIKSVCEKLGLRYVEVHGGVPQKKKFEAIETFNEDKNIPIFIGHPDSVGIGINLVAAKYSIFYSRNFSFVADEQAEARNYRGGSEIHQKITRLNIVAEGTIDEKVSLALARKEELSAEVLKTIAHTF